jgi:putative CocE/NonD family hydrolase
MSPLKRTSNPLCFLNFVTTVALLLCVSLPCRPSSVDQLPPNAQIGNYVGKDIMIPMRDGTKLHAEMWRPKGVTGNLPILMQRSPYGFNYAQVARSFDSEYKELGQEGFIFILEDIRGRFGSEGEFVMLRPQATTPEGIDESTDTYDSISWLIKSVPNNNKKVGIFGVSYLGWTANIATINPHPALMAVSAQASFEDLFLGDDFYHNGAFRLSYAWEYAAALETDGRTMNPFGFEKGDPYAWYLRQYDIATLDKRAFGRTLPTWQNFVDHPNYDAYWRAGLTSARLPKHVAVPNLMVAGWWDQEDFYGPVKTYKEQERGDDRGLNYLVIGPWYHGGWARGSGDHYGPFDLGSQTAVYFRAKVETLWFKHWLKDDGALNLPRALVFETGSNQWQRYDSWPPRTGVQHKQLYFRANKVLSFEPPKSPGDDNPDRFLSDPSNPVPYLLGPPPSVVDENSAWHLWLASDQAPFSKRADVLSYQTESLQSDVTIRGSVIAKLFASTTGSDADWVVKLLDVYPSDEETPQAVRGRQLIIADEVFRGRFRSSFEYPKPIVPGAVLNYSIDMHSASHVFKKGHRIAVQVQSTWFPLIDRNPQTFQASIFNANRDQYKAQTHSVFHTAQYPSAIAVDVADE